MILDYLGGLHVMTRVLMKVSQKIWSHRVRCGDGRSDCSAPLLAGPQSEEWEQAFRS